ncbi:hypothetical protein MRB53_012652 [Persea americana]|uniref:Uncharacterized protein n=1 Tax=Persea americana TaxID=3435 RepID=A0ACC2LYC8_PERAE|nr:hypothetical protein MRB53_012652 [Persea americana]
MLLELFTVNESPPPTPPRPTNHCWKIARMLLHFDLITRFQECFFYALQFMKNISHTYAHVGRVSSARYPDPND